MEKLNKN